MQTAQAPIIPIAKAIAPATPPSKIERSEKLNNIDASLAPIAFKIAASYFLAFSVDAAVPIKTKKPVNIVVVAPYKTTEEIELRILETCAIASLILTAVIFGNLPATSRSNCASAFGFA